VAFRNAGWPTVASARNINDLADLAAIGCNTLQLDVADETSRRAAIRAVELEHGPIGVNVNNAGHGQYGPPKKSRRRRSTVPSRPMCSGCCT
jgi:NADP-dependent 3-hydroxy acid dehydrogenase YdfG